MTLPDGSSVKRQEQRPEFMVQLGLLPPYTLSDVKKAYLDKVKTAHPDHGGNLAEFRVIQDAYEEAQRYVQFRSDKRSWIAAQMDRYMALEALENQLKNLGAEVSVQHTDWLQRSYGDFAELTALLRSVKLQDSTAGKEVVELLVANHAASNSLKLLELVGCDINDATALRLSCLQLLEVLDLSRNAVTGRVTELVDAIPRLSVFHLRHTSVSPWEKFKLTRRLRKRLMRKVV